MVVYPCWGRFNYDIWAEGDLEPNAPRDYRFVRARRPPRARGSHVPRLPRGFQDWPEDDTEHHGHHIWDSHSFTFASSASSRRVVVRINGTMPVNQHGMASDIVSNFTIDAASGASLATTPLFVVGR